MFFAINLLTTSAIVAIISEIGRRWLQGAGMMTALPISTALSLFWMWRQGVPRDSLSAFVGTVLVCMPATALILFLTWAVLKRA